MRGRDARPAARVAAALILVALVAACGARGPGERVATAPLPPPVPVEVAPLPPPPAVARAPAAARTPTYDDGTGLPAGWYVPEPPPDLETGATVEPAPAAQPAPATEQAAPAPPRPDPERRARALLREYPWIAAFWAELGPAQRARAERAFARRGTREGLAAEWDRMGLQDRVVLLFGPGRGA